MTGKTHAMVPNFALALSFEGISLLRRMGGAWARIEDVPLDSDTLDADVRALSTRALSLDPSGQEVCLVIPNEQIRYLEIEDPGNTGSARDGAILAALDGATPYDVGDLVYAHSRLQGQLMIAAVAEETLEEAEAFALQHGFKPVSFVAIAPEGAFRGAVFFGPTNAWEGEEVAAPPKAMRIVPAGKRALLPSDGSDLSESTDLPEPEVEDDPEPVQAPVLETTPEDAPTPDPDPADDLVADNTPLAFDTVAKTGIEAEDSARRAMEAREAELDREAQLAREALEQPVVFESHRRDPDPAPDVPEIAADAPLIEAPEPAPEAEPKLTWVDSELVAAPPDEDNTPFAERFAARSKETPAPEAYDDTANMLRERAEASFRGAPAPEPEAASEPPAPMAFSTVRASRSAPGVPPAPRPLVLDQDDTSSARVTPRFTPLASKGTVVREAGVTADRVVEPDVPDMSDIPPAPSVTPPVASPADTPKAPPLNNLARRAPVVDPSKADKPGFAAPVADKTGKKPLISRPALAGKATKPPLAADGPVVERPKGLPPIAARGATPDVPPGDAKPAGNALSRLAALRAAPKAAVPKSPPPALPDTPAVANGGGGAATFAPDNERDRMTVFGARSRSRVGGKPRFLGLLLTTILLLFLAGVAAWASVFLDDGLAGIFKRNDTRAIAEVPDVSSQDIAVAATDDPSALRLTPQPSAAPQNELRLAALESSDVPITDAPRALSPTIAPQALTPEEAAATYAATGIWQRAPVGPLLPPSDGVDDIYVASIDPAVRQFDAVALPNPLAMSQEPGLTDPGLPPPFGLTFDFDERGLIVATPEGALTPDGLRIYAGLPPVVPPARPEPETLRPEISTDPDVNPLGKLRPKPRPTDLIEQRERATLQGISRSELATIRPVMRPKTAQEEALAADPDSLATDQAIGRSLVPVARPRNMAAIVDRAVKTPAAPAAPVQTAAVAPRSVQPNIPTATSVARSATVKNAINLRKINLIGVFGTSSNRRALVRLANGRYEKVKVGDRLDGGRVESISEGALVYRKSGRNVTLKMPKT